MESFLSSQLPSIPGFEHELAQALFLQAHEGILVTDGQGQIVAANPPAHRLFDYEEGTMTSLHLQQLVTHYSDENDRWVPRLLEESRREALCITGQAFTGQTLKLKIKTHRLEEAGDLHFLLFAEDTHNTDELFKMQELIEEAELLAHLGTFELDLHTLKSKRSPGTLKLLNVTEPDANAGSYADFVSRLFPEDRIKVDSQLAAARQGEEHLEWEQRVMMPDGSERFLHSRARVSKNPSGKPISLMGVHQDVTSSRQAEARVLEALWKGQEEERQKIAREIHDGFGPTLATTKLYLETIRAYLPKARWPELDHQLENLTAFHRSIRNLSHQLLPKSLSDFGLAASVENLCLRLEQNSTLDIDYVCQGIFRRFPLEVELSLYRILQALTDNVLQHARADRLYIRLDWQPGRLIIVVEDNGIGFEPKQVLPKNGIGLTNVQTRVQSLHGTVTINSAVEQGTRVTITIPGL